MTEVLSNPSRRNIPRVLLVGSSNTTTSRVRAALHQSDALDLLDPVVEMEDEESDLFPQQVTVAVVVAQHEDNALWRRVMGLARPPNSLPVVVIGPESLRTTAFLIGAEDWLPTELLMNGEHTALIRSIHNAVIRRRVAGGLPVGGHLHGLVTGVAHEVNNPLTVINADLEHAVEQLQELVTDVTNDDLHEALSELCDILEDDILASKRISTVTRALQNLARLADTVPAALHTGPAVRRVLARVSETHPGSPPPSVPEDTEFRVHASVHGFEEALFNVLENALHAQKLAGCSAPVTVRVDETVDTVEFWILDEGDGVRADIAGREVKPFVTGRPPGEGLGLGLTVSALAVQRAGGELTVGPRGNGGTAVCLRFLRAKQKPESVTEEDTSAVSV